MVSRLNKLVLTRATQITNKFSDRSEREKLVHMNEDKGSSLGMYN